MKKSTLLLIIIFFSFAILNGTAQKMNNERLETILNVVSDSIVGQNGSWQFKINERIFMCITDENHNRMRIISPITEQDNLTQEDLIKVLEANYHTALDVKYSLSNNLLWSVFIHPLTELTDKQVKDAVSQVYFAALTYGSSYSSTNLSFPSNSVSEEGSETEIKLKTREVDKKLLKKM